MRIHIRTETAPGERRVAIVPKTAAKLVGLGHEISVEPGAGRRAGYEDSVYAAAGARLGAPAPGHLLATVSPLAPTEATGAGAVLGFLDPLGNPERMSAYAAAGIDVIAMELVPRTTLAQTMDALSSQATIAGYEAVLLGAAALPRIMPMMMTAAGTLPPATVLVLGAGVAGLQAIATARRLGAVVYAYDIRPAAAEQVQSLGARFVAGPVAAEAEMAGGYAAEVTEETRRQQFEALADQVSRSDLVIATAQVPGRPAPILLTAEMVKSMRSGSVVVDVAAPTGGNCAVTVPGEMVEYAGVAVHGPLDLASRAAGHASEMYSRNLESLLTHMSSGLEVDLDSDDEITRGCVVVRSGRVVNERVAAMVAAP